MLGEIENRENLHGKSPCARRHSCRRPGSDSDLAAGCDGSTPEGTVCQKTQVEFPLESVLGFECARLGYSDGRWKPRVTLLEEL